MHAGAHGMHGGGAGRAPEPEQEVMGTAGARGGAGAGEPAPRRPGLLHAPVSRARCMHACFPPTANQPLSVSDLSLPMKTMMMNASKHSKCYCARPCLVPKNFAKYE